MGLTITGMGSKKEYSFGYTALHLIRFLACKTAGFEGTIDDFNEKGTALWDQYPQFYQLLHFSDCNGFLVPEWCLKDIDYSESFHLGSLTRLVNELEKIQIAITENPEEYSDKTLNTWASKPFWTLYNLATDELKEHGGVLKFH